MLHSFEDPLRWNDEEVIAEILRLSAEGGAILQDDHVVLTPKAGRHFHSPSYFNKDRVMADPLTLVNIAGLIAKRFCDEQGNTEVQAVVGPTMGAVALAAVTMLAFEAIAVERMRNSGVVWTYAEEREDKTRHIKRLPDLVLGRNVLVVEDVFSSGGSALATLEAVRAAGGNVIGVAVICNRGGVTAEQLGVPRLETLIEMPMVMHAEDECPLCASNMPINMHVGHGQSFFQRYPDSPVPRGNS